MQGQSRGQVNEARQPVLDGNVNMPLIKSASKQAFKKNISKEVAAGKPIKQAVAIAYATKRAAQHPHHSRHIEELGSAYESNSVSSGARKPYHATVELSTSPARDTM